MPVVTKWQHIVSNVFRGLLLSTIFLITACNESFSPLKENDAMVFSMVGVLDINADTQWVRVMPIGKSLLPTDTTSNGTVVRMIRESTGDVTIMNDSLFQFNQDAYVWNYWTDVPVRPEEYYTIVAESQEGEQSIVTIKTPSIAPMPEVEFNERFERIQVSGVVTDTLVVLESRYLVQPITDMGCSQEMEVVISHMDQVVVRGENQYYLTVENSLALSQEVGVNSMIINRRALVVISATDDWPDGTSLTENEMALPDIISNVQNGTGVVAGIARHEIIITPKVPVCVPN